MLHVYICMSTFSTIDKEIGRERGREREGEREREEERERGREREREGGGSEGEGEGEETRCPQHQCLLSDSALQVLGSVSSWTAATLCLATRATGCSATWCGPETG